MNAPHAISIPKEYAQLRADAYANEYDAHVAEARGHMADALACLHRIEEMGAAKFGPTGHDFGDITALLSEWSKANWPDHAEQVGA